MWKVSTDNWGLVWKPGSLGAPDQGTNEDCEGDATRVSLKRGRVRASEDSNLHCLRDQVGSAVGHFTKDTRTRSVSLTWALQEDEGTEVRWWGSSQ